MEAATQSPILLICQGSVCAARHLRAGQVHAADAFNWKLRLAALNVVAAAPAGPPPALIQCMVRSVRLPNEHWHGYGNASCCMQPPGLKPAATAL